MTHQTLAIVIGIFFLATIFRTLFGFGEALVAVPLLALTIPVKLAAPVAVLASIVIAAFIVLRDWRHIHLRSAGWLIFSTVFGLPVGLWVLKTLPESLVKSVLAGVLLTFSGYSLLRPRRALLENDRFAWAFGFAAGVFGGSYGLNGPPLAIYGSLRGWTPERFRATLQGYFLPASALGMFGYWLTGLWTPTVTHLFLASLPAIVAGILAGRLLSRRIAPHRFDRLVYCALLIIGVVLLAQNL